MTDPKQPTDKVVLNAISYKENNDGKIVSTAPICVDISGLLKEYNVFPTSIYGISSSTDKEGECGESVVHTNFVVSEDDIRKMINKIYNIVDAAIVNMNQSLAVKKLIDDVLDSFIEKCLNKIRG